MGVCPLWGCSIGGYPIRGYPKEGWAVSTLDSSHIDPPRRYRGCVVRDPPSKVRHGSCHATSFHAEVPKILIVRGHQNAPKLKLQEKLCTHTPEPGFGPYMASWFQQKSIFHQLSAASMDSQR